MDVDEFEDYLELQNQKGRSDIEISRKEYLPAKAGQLMSFWLNSKPKRKGSAASKSEEEVLGAAEPAVSYLDQDELKMGRDPAPQLLYPT